MIIKNMADKLPIVLAHGLCGFDEFKIFGITIQYFKGIKNTLKIAAMLFLLRG